ncbi:MAG TPA: choice-of-anchor Q domain-containing protein [Edaphobacter sp.]|nr:choice-of-anchor Q domain-containing protein [Edaphobacter sp.]
MILQTRRWLPNRELIVVADSAFAAQINLSATTYVLTIGKLDIRRTLSIRGKGSDLTTIDGANRFKLLQILNPGTNPIVNILNLTLQNGLGGIDFGTGIYNDTGSYLYLIGCVVRDNKSNVGGVGIANAGVLTMIRSTVRGNQVTGSGGGITGTGGGILTFAEGTAKITESTISGNQAIRGGAISNDGQMEVTNSSIAGNIASAGGGIRNTGGLSIAFSTITDNEAGLVSGEPLSTRFGGGILNFSHVSMGNSILAGNRDRRIPADPLFGPDCFSQDMFGFTSFRGNIVDMVNGNCSFLDTLYGAPPPFDTIGTNNNPVDARFGPFLDYNGGPTRTFAVVSGSSAIDNGTGVSSATFFDCPRTDQRGYLRPVDGDNVVDIGDLAFVSQQLPPGTTCP